MNRYHIYAIVWDICKRPLYRGIATRNYIQKCIDMELPFDIASFYIKAQNEKAAIHYLESRFGAKMKQWHVVKWTSNSPDLDERFQWEIA